MFGNRIVTHHIDFLCDDDKAVEKKKKKRRKLSVTSYLSFPIAPVFDKFISVLETFFWVLLL